MQEDAECHTCYNHLHKCWDTPTKNRPFFLQIAASHSSWDIILTSHSSPFKVVPLRFEHDLKLLATLIRGGRESQAQDHGQAIQAKLGHSILRVFFQVVVTWSPQAQTILILDIHVMVNSQPYLGRYPSELRSWYRLNLSIIFIWALSSLNAKSIWSKHRHLTCGGGLSDFRNKCPAKKSWNEPS